MNSQRTSFFASVALTACLALAAPAIVGCSMTVGAVHPHPSVSIAGEVGKFAIDTSAIPDTYEPGNGLHILQFHETLANGLQAAVSDRFVTTPDDKTTKLVFTDMSMSLSSIGDVASFLLIRFHAKWVTADGHVLSEVSGTAKPVNPTEPGARHIEDAVEVMYSQLIEGLEKSKKGGTSSADTEAK